MSIRELALNLIEHADTAPHEIDLARAAELISWLDPDAGLPEDLTPEALMEAWNDIVRSGSHDDNWSPETVRYEVRFTDSATCAVSPIETVTATADYTADDYVRDCMENADSDWCDMLRSGTVSLVRIDD